MFGGAGIYCDGLIFGLLLDDDVLYLKADAESIPLCSSRPRNGGPFSYDSTTRGHQGDHVVLAHARAAF